MCESFRLIWQKDLGGEFSEDVWQDFISNVGWATRDARSKFIHYKIVHRYYLTPLKLFKLSIINAGNVIRSWAHSSVPYGTVLWYCPSGRWCSKTLRDGLNDLYQNPHNYAC